MHSQQAGVTGFVHIGLVVEDLDEAGRFLAPLGFEAASPRCTAATGSAGSSAISVRGPRPEGL